MCFTDFLSNVPPASDRQTGKQTDRQTCISQTYCQSAPPASSGTAILVPTASPGAAPGKRGNP